MRSTDHKILLTEWILGNGAGRKEEGKTDPT